MMHHFILVDTSVWVEYFRRGSSRPAMSLDGLLAAGVVAICDPIRVEILSGAMSKDRFEKLNDFLKGLRMFEPPQDIWDRIAQARSLLARKGIQATVMDLWIAIIAAQEHILVWALDKDFLAIREVVHFDVFDPDAVGKASNKKTLS